MERGSRQDLGWQLVMRIMHRAVVFMCRAGPNPKISRAVKMIDKTRSYQMLDLVIKV